MPLGPSLLGARSGANLLEPPFAWYAQLLGSSWQAGLGQYKAEQCDNGIAGIAGIAMGDLCTKCFGKLNGRNAGPRFLFWASNLSFHQLIDLFFARLQSPGLQVEMLLQSKAEILQGDGVQVLPWGCCPTPATNSHATNHIKRAREQVNWQL